MKKIFSIVFFLFFSAYVFSQDSLRLILCSYPASDCFGYPSLEKTIQHFDTLGNITEENNYYWERCDEENVDSDYIHGSDVFYVYDSLQHLIYHQSNNYNGDTVIQSQVQTSYMFDSLGNQVSRHVEVTLPLPVYEQAFDSAFYNSDNLKVFDLSLRWNFALLELDTTYREEFYYDSLNRLTEDYKFLYMNFINNDVARNYYSYDTLSNVIAEYTAVNYPVFDSTRYVHVYDTLSEKIETWYQKWDTLNSVWISESRTTFSYDVLSRLSTQYLFYCPDTFCTDSILETVYTYYPNNSYETEKYVYQGNDWEFSGNTYIVYDNLGYLLESGWWDVDFEGCDESNHLTNEYNSDHQLVHSHSIHYTCDYRITDCDYYNLNEDSIVVLINSDTYPCAFDTIHFQVAIAGGTPPYIYHWSPLTNVLDTNVESPRIVTDSTIIYTLVVIDSLGLSGSFSDTLFVKPNHLQPVTIQTSGLPCEGNPFFLIFESDDLVSPWTPEWQFNNQNIGISDTDSCAVPFSGIYSVIIYDPATACTVQSNEIVVNLFPQPDAEVTTPGNAEACEGDSVELVSNTFPQVVWNTGDTANVIYALSSGDYFTIVSDTNGCRDTSNITQVVIHPLPLISLGNDTILCVNQNIVLDAGAGYLGYQWQDGTTGQTFNAASLVPDSVLYFVEVSDSNNCTGADTIQVIYDLCSEVSSLSKHENIYLFPNPSVTSILYIRSEYLKPNTFFKLLDLSGREVFSLPVHNIFQQVQIPLLAKGVYQFQITASGEELKSGKFVIE